MSKYRIYTKKRLSQINAVYLSEYWHHIEKSDVQTANQCIKTMYTGLNSNEPQIGDIVHYTTREGTYYPHAHIDDIRDGVVSVCLNPFVPFVCLRDKKISFSSVSGGPWVQISKEKMRKCEVETKTFQFFGSSGVCAHGAIQFEGYANCWEYKEDGLLFGEFSTKEYARTVYRKIDTQWYVETTDPDNDIPQPNGNAFKKWLQELRGVQFGDFEKDDMVTVFTYKEVNRLVRPDFWQQLDLPISTRRINGRNHVDVKLDTNDRQKMVVVYRYANN